MHCSETQANLALWTEMIHQTTVAAVLHMEVESKILKHHQLIIESVKSISKNSNLQNCDFHLILYLRYEQCLETVLHVSTR